MDELSKAVSAQFATKLAADDAGLYSVILNCLKTRCNSTVGKCRSKEGPCPVQKISLDSRRACRPLKKYIMKANEHECTEKARRLFANIPPENVGDPTAALSE